MLRPIIFAWIALLSVPLWAAVERKSWNKVRMIGGTFEGKTSRYDWNATITVTDDLITITIDPVSVFDKRQIIRMKPSAISGLFAGSTAWRRTSEVIAPATLRKPPTLFGVLVDDIGAAILYDTDGGKRGALLFESPYQYLILRVLSQLSGKTIE